MSQQIKDKFGPTAGVPLLGPNAGSAQASTDPMSPQSLGAAALMQQLQATADTRYDPTVPPPIENFMSYAKYTPYKPYNTQKAVVGIALLLIGGALVHACLKP